jgi:DNA-binding MarR family transcriptional regulator
MLDRKKYVEELIEGTQLLRRKASGLSHAKDGITPSQWQVIGHIFRHEGCTTNEVATALNMTGSAVTQLVNRLVAEGYVKREENAEDRRAHRLILSAQSKKRINAFKAKRLDLMLKLYSALTDAEFKQYLALNKKVISGLEKKTL